MVSNGEIATKFEDKVARFLDSSQAISRTSGTDALILALKLVGVTSGDKVILPTYVCRNVSDAIISVGAYPQFCDVNLNE